ncbi:MAG: zinc-binding alcohol dehydrogenase, partial [Holophagaceae bacterium]|nr:zinc-binding alcohol dehydrogenase [Holophagaceae bacterium]
GAHDVQIEIAYCGICHSDIHQVRDEWGGSKYPMVPGHEIVGKVTAVGAHVKAFKVGDLAGVGCPSCQRNLEQFCEKGAAFSYNGTEMDRKTLTYGGYSSSIVVDEAFTLKISPKLDLAAAAPLLCAGITTYSPLRHWKTKQGDKVGVVGLGGLGHMAVKIAAAMGAEVTMLSTSKAKEADARKLGAHHFGLTSDDATFKHLAGRFDLIIDTISAPHDYNKYLGLLRIEGAMVLLGVPPEPTPVAAGSLIFGRRTLSGSLIGGIKETQEMLDFCAEHGIVSEIELIPVQQVNQAYERMMKNDVRYRFVLDMKTL